MLIQFSHVCLLSRHGSSSVPRIRSLVLSCGIWGEHVAFRTAAAASRKAKYREGCVGDKEPGATTATMDKGVRAYTAENFPWTIGQQLSEKQQRAIRKLLCQYADCFAFSMKELGRCIVAQFHIQVNSPEPVFKRRHRLSPAEWELVDARCRELAERRRQG